MPKIGEDSLTTVSKVVAAVVVAAAVLAFGVGSYVALTREAPAYTGSYTPPAPEPPKPPPTLALPANPKVLFVGDSLTDGNGASDKARLGWVPQLATRMGWTDYRVDAFGLTGFLRPGGNEKVDRTYGTRTAQFHDREPDFTPDLVVFQGGFNDSTYRTEALTVAVRDTIENTRKIWPNAQFLVIGPISSHAKMNRITWAYLRGAGIAGVPAIDMNRKPAFNSDKDGDLYLTEDGWHPNDAGYELVATTLQERIAGLTPNA